MSIVDYRFGTSLPGRSILIIRAALHGLQRPVSTVLHRDYDLADLLI